MSRMRFLLVALLTLSFIAGKSFQKVFCIHLDTKSSHIETIQICESTTEIHVGIDKAPFQDEKLKLKNNFNFHTFTFNIDTTSKVAEAFPPLRFKTRTHSLNSIKTVRLIT